MNEYLIGREVFDRDEGYNPAADPIVRVGAHDIRKKLEIYYQHEGANDELRLDIPIGSYEPIFIRKNKLANPPAPAEDLRPELLASAQILTLEESGTPIEVNSAPSSPEENLAGLRRQLRWLYSAVVFLSAVIAILALLFFSASTQKPSADSTRASAALGPVWEPFMKSDSSTLLVLSSPLVYRLMNAGDPMVAVKSSVELPPDQAASVGRLLRDYFAVRNSPRTPRLVLSQDTYTGLGEAFGAQRVTDLLRTVGKNVTIKRSRTVSAEDLKDHHVVLFGSVWANEWSGKLPLVEDFHVTGQATIENHNPRPNEEKEYRSKFDEATGKLIEDYAIVTVKSNISNPNLVMVLAGLRSAGTEAAAEYVTNRTHLNDLNQRLREMGAKNGSPLYYQALLKVGVENGIPTTISLVTIHELRKTDR
ncbi:MAG TPA: hypothetical protein VJ302_13115 [Blastocatellia bacterium]|nr:hypothetical protein [Blastocatellia bacterium]